jgi:hypothetical protein
LRQKEFSRFLIRCAGDRDECLFQDADVVSTGRLISAYPDVILKMGVKEVLQRTRHLGWGTETHLYRRAEEFRDSIPARLRSAGPRVIKQNRGNAGQGVWKVEWLDQPGSAAGAGGAPLQHARDRATRKLHVPM